MTQFRSGQKAVALSLIFSIGSSFAALAYYKPTYTAVSPYCPTNSLNQKLSWRDYMAGRYPDVPGHRSAIALVQFRYAKEVNNRAALPGIDPGACYGVIYNDDVKRRRDPNGYMSWALYDYNVPHPEGLVSSGLARPGSPDRYEINIMNVVLHFNEAGEVLNMNNQLVGVMVCYLSNDCGGYRY